jgi:hypothetical protein
MGKYKYLFWFVETSRLFIIAKIWKTRISIKCIIMALMLIMACCMFIVLHVDTSPNISMLPWLSHAHEYGGWCVSKFNNTFGNDNATFCYNNNTFGNDKVTFCYNFVAVTRHLLTITNIQWQSIILQQHKRIVLIFVNNRTFGKYNPVMQLGTSSKWRENGA